MVMGRDIYFCGLWDRDSQFKSRIAALHPTKMNFRIPTCSIRRPDQDTKRHGTREREWWCPAAPLGSPDAFMLLARLRAWMDSPGCEQVLLIPITGQAPDGVDRTAPLLKPIHAGSLEFDHRPEET
ncbi:hypothetical protein TsFJ059_005776 [Trichoderma semiorbis]|uniref:Uncharacterized protein n=1 Tax=Trichoderma semiorbis TaxID=1491008 RepID=A0A9P8HCI2_9HYPO|nr:hypothetical protein TsFJ059_005776 [Trichoderma semiorbis]